MTDQVDGKMKKKKKWEILRQSTVVRKMIKVNYKNFAGKKEEYTWRTSNCIDNWRTRQNVTITFLPSVKTQSQKRCRCFKAKVIRATIKYNIKLLHEVKDYKVEINFLWAVSKAHKWKNKKLIIQI